MLKIIFTLQMCLISGNDRATRTTQRPNLAGWHGIDAVTSDLATHRTKREQCHHASWRISLLRFHTRERKWRKYCLGKRTRNFPVDSSVSFWESLALILCR